MIRLPLPPSANALSRAAVKGNRAVVLSSKAYRGWKHDAYTWLAATRTELLDGPVRVDMSIYYADRRRDADSAVKPILDILQGYCYANDRQVTEIHVYAHVDKADPRVEVTVEDA